MISALFGIVKLVAKVAVGCTKIAYGATKLAVRVGKGVAKGGWRAMKKGKRLGKGVMRVVQKSRIMARDNIPSSATVKSHLFTKPTKAESVINNSRNSKAPTPKKPETAVPPEVSEAHIFTKK